MKKTIKVLLLAALCIALLTACQFVPYNPNEETTTTGCEDDVVDTTPVTLVKANKTSDYLIYIPADMAGSAQELLNSFTTKLTRLTGVAKMKVWQVTETASSDFEIVVNVNKERADAAASWNNTKLTDYELTRNGNRIIITARDNDALEMILNHLADSMKKDDAGNWIVEADKLSLHGSWLTKQEDSVAADFDKYLDAVNSIPAYATENGTMQPMYWLSKDGYQFAYVNTTKAEYDAYVEALTEAGFKLYSESKLPGNKATSTNVYGTYTQDDLHVFATWHGDLNLARISFMPPATLQPLTGAPAATAKKIEPTVAQIQLDDGGNLGGTGMSYVIQFEDGKFMIIDGGASGYSFNADNMNKYLLEKAQAAGYEKPVIAMWFFTHSHDDHIGVASARMLEIASKNGYTVEAFAYNFPVQKYINLDVHPLEDTSGTILALEINLRRFFKNVPVYTLHAGQQFYFQGATWEILATEEEVYPYKSIGTHNGACVTSRVKFDSGKTAMFLADNAPQINEQLATIYGDYLKSDVLQVAHHGLTGAEITSYKAINPDICLWPTSESRFSGYYDSAADGSPTNDDQWCIGYRFQIDGKTKKIVMSLISEPNVWLREIDHIEILEDSYVVHFKEDAYREHYHASQTTILNMNDLEADPVIVVNVKPTVEGTK